jgi:RHS repeat-associated protein
MTKKSVDGSVTSYVYNTEDRLAEVWSGEAGSGSLIAAYYYDPFGRRLWKEVGGVRTYFHYADEGLVGEYDAGGNEIKTYGYKPGSTWTTDPLFMEVGSEYYFYHNDHLGTPQKMTAVNGAIVWSAKYEGFGKAVVEVGTVVNNLRFPGQYQDQETGLHYNYHRYYDLSTGRYLCPDPSHTLQPKGSAIPHLFPSLLGMPQELHNYTYALNNSISQIDMYGLFSTCPQRQHRVYDNAGLANCMLTSQNAVVFCTTCAISGVVAFTNPVMTVPAIAVGVAACSICLYEVVRCMAENSKCECD